ncbi:MAG: response regulator [Cyanobacteria bacterium]|nr:response regulator [Cyanobacteriota bacterium]
MTKILIIEDDPSLLNNLADILTLENYQVITASDGQQGIEAAITHQPDLILCDVMMPAMDGFGVVKCLREQPDTSHIPFIFLTAKADRLDQREGMTAGADDYLTKPFRPQEVLTAVQVRLARHNTLTQPYRDEQQRSKTLEQQLRENTDLAKIKANLLTKLSEDLREPLGNVNLALHMLGHAQTEADRDRYLNILKQEYTREMRLLQDVANLQAMVTPENIKVLRQFNLLLDKV